MLPSIFVKIPLEINQQYQNRNTARNNLIKSEEVKFENNDPSNLKTPPASTPTPPASSTTPERPLSLPSISTIHGTSNLFVITGSDNSRSNSSTTDNQSIGTTDAQAPSIYRCELCPFISIYEDNLYSHIDEHTQRKFLRKKYFCPGCDNVHYEKVALKSHLLQDHAMTVDETNVLVEYILKYNSFGPSRKGRGKGRISIKNATQLKKPDLLLENGQEQNSVVNGPSQTKSQPKIFVKSVQYLKGPEFCFNTESVPVLDSFQPQPSSLDAFQFHASDPTPPPFASIFNTIPMQNSDVTVSYFDNTDSGAANDSNIGEFTQESPSDVKTTTNSGKIYLKDISVLQRPEPTIHLKTVDELNAMAFNPNLNNITTGFQSNFVMDSVPDCFNNGNNDIINLDENEISDLIELNSDENYSQNSFTALLNHDFDTVSMDSEAKKVECGNSSSNETVVGHEFVQNVSHLDENDEDILFVCAQEIINANMEETEGKTRDLETPVPPMMTSSSQAKPRIYLASNLTNDFVPPAPVAMKTFATTKQKQGRPKGARKSGVSQWRKNLPVNITEDDVLGPKCQIDGCALRFKYPKNMDYHRQCHPLMVNGETICPECRSAEFKNWNTLHTHLWRTHNIDMELYACNKCSFKTPILARLKSEHMKIHSDIHEYKCGLCGRGFKNAKQRKHHVRMHRLRMNSGKQLVTTQKKPEVRKCNQCPMTFANTVALESHIIDVHTPVQEKKDVLAHLPESISPHEIKKHKCTDCNYESNDHNAFRRHKFQHSKDLSGLYKCPFCTYSSIQSTTYRKHLEKQHPDKASDFVFKCPYFACKFTTISKQKFDCHVTRHKSKGDPLNPSSVVDSNNSSSDLVGSQLASALPCSNRAEIKVRQILSLTDPIRSTGPIIRPASFACLDLETEHRTDLPQTEQITVYETSSIPINDSDSL